MFDFIKKLRKKTRFHAPEAQPGAEGSASDDYARRVQNEQAFYANCENVHELPEIFHYWSNKYLAPEFQAWGFASPDDFFLQQLRLRLERQPEHFFRIISIGAGNCDLESNIASELVNLGLTHFRIDCLDINPDMLERGRQHAVRLGVPDQIGLVESDFNRWQADDGCYDVVIANQSLHHVLDLEHLFDAAYKALAPDGAFLISDMIGRNGHMRWPEALDAMQPFWEELPESYRYNQLMQRMEPKFINHDCSQSGFEGIRAQDILPLLNERFGFELFFPYGNIVFPFIDRGFGHNFDAEADWDRAFIDRLHERDHEGMLAGELTPTSMLAVAVKGDPGQVRLRDPNLTPERCIRRP